MPSETTKKLFTVEDYYRMVDAGILRADDRTELIKGEIVQMSPVGLRHAAVTNRAAAIFIPLLKEKAIVQVMNPITLGQFNEPVPDLSIVKYRADYYEFARPTPADIVFVLEISDTSLHYDKNVKLPVYAACAIPEAWIGAVKAGS